MIKFNLTKCSKTRYLHTWWDDAELQQADYLMQVAKNEYLNAAYNYLQAEIELENDLKK